VFVGRLPLYIDEDQLKQVFGVFGPVIRCVILKTDNNISKGFGVLQFESQDSATKAVHSIIRINGFKRLLVKFERPEELDRRS